MVMIQVLIAQVTLNDNEEFGIELGLQDGLLFDRSAAIIRPSGIPLSPVLRSITRLWATAHRTRRQFYAQQRSAGR